MAQYPVGMKIYDNDWFLKHSMEPAEVADFLAGLGINFVITQSQYLPMQDSAVVSSVDETMQQQYDELDDLQFRHALKERNIDYFACMNVGFDATAARGNPDWLPLDQNGELGEQTDWYVGIPPSNKKFIAAKAETLRHAVEILQPDGVHLGFARWPGFWETWLPALCRQDMREFCFKPDTLDQFCIAKNVELPTSDPVASAELIFANHRDAFTDWKCDVTQAMIGQLRTAAHSSKADIPVAINTLPFEPTEFEGAVEQVLGQRHAKLGSVVDIFEVMAYHQILRRDTSWPGQISAAIKNIANQKTICTVQTGSHYTSGMHLKAGRNDTVTAIEVEEMVSGVLASHVDGICFFTLSDFLAGSESQKMQHIVRAI